MMMREAPADLAPSYAGATIRTRVDVWRGEVLLAEDVPILDGELVEAADQAVPEELNLVVPALDARGRLWRPRAPLDPLNTFGQRARVTYLVDDVPVPLGWYQLDEHTSDEWTVEVSAVGLLARVADDKLPAPTSPPPTATFATELRRLVDGILPVSTLGAPADRAIPAALAWQDDRLEALYELADAWGAELVVDSSGTLTVLETVTLETAGPADLTLEVGDPVRGVVITATAAGSRSSVYNAVVARGEAANTPDRAPVQAIAYDEDSSSPTYAGGPYGVVTRLFSSPLLNTEAQCLKAARTMVGKSTRAARTIPVTCIPDPRIVPGTLVDLVEDGVATRTMVLRCRLPLTAAGGAQSLTLGVL